MSRSYDLGSIEDSGALFVRKVSWRWTVIWYECYRSGLVTRGGEEGDGKLEWDESPDLRWPELGVRVRDPFHEERRITKTDAKKDLDVFDEELLVEEE